MKVCKDCREINSNDSAFCCNCGKSNFIYQEEVVCPHCGKVNDKTFEHCIHCGQELEKHVHAAELETYNAVPVNVRDDMTTVYSAGLTTETARCPHCNTSVPVTAIFCAKCGTNVADLHEHRIVQRKVCPHCGNFNPVEAARCSYCFSGLGDALTEDLQVTHQSQNLGDKFVRQTFLEGPKGKKLMCPSCGAINASDEVFCVNCGLKLDIEPVKKYCPNCGTENPSDSEFCSKCRWSFEGASPEEKIKWVCSFCQHVNSDEDAYCSNCGQKRKV